MPNHQDRVRRNYSNIAETVVQRIEEEGPPYRCLQCGEVFGTIPEALYHTDTTNHAVALRLTCDNPRRLGVVSA